MDRDAWIIVRNWEQFQHYSDRNPVWIKLYTELNSDDHWRRLTFGQRGLLVSIWTEYGRSNGRLRSLDLWARVGQQDRHGNLKALNDAGFITFTASEPLSLARSREERREEKTRARAQEHPKTTRTHTATKTTTPPNSETMNAGAYQPFDTDTDAPPEIDIDQAALELARTWLAEHSV